MPTPKKAIQFHTKHYTKAEKAAREKRENDLKDGRDELFAPDFLTAKAKADFNRIVAETKKAGILDNLDLGILAMYANAYVHYVDGVKKINEMGDVLETSQGYRMNPYITTNERYVSQILKCSAKLGLATTDRLKLVVPEKKQEKEENKFIRLLKNG